VVLVQPAEVTVLRENGMRPIVTELQPESERTTGQAATMRFGEAGEPR
jgi:hypothetical protein